MTRVVLAIGRWMPIHKGHKSFLVKLARSFDKLIIGIGSCYENGTPRNCIPAIEREKLLRCALRAEGIEDSRIAIVPVEDRETFEEWIDDVLALCRIHGVTHFCTGNKEDILDVLSEKGIKLGVYSNKPDNIVKNLINKFFPETFISVRGQTPDVPVKPSPEGAFLVADEMGVSYENCLFVGDSVEDCHTALNAGMIPVNVSWGYRPRDFLLKNGAEICIDNPIELLDLLVETSEEKECC